MNRRRHYAVALGCLLIFTKVVLAKVAILNDAPALVNPSFEEPGKGVDEAAGWGRWGQWMNREEGWTPVHSGHCLLGYHHWDVTDANDSGIYQDVLHAVKDVRYAFSIYANPDKAKPPTVDAVTIELRLESTVDGQQKTVASKSYKLADLPANQWEKLTVSGAPVNDTLRVLVIVTPAPQNGGRGGAIRFDDAFLEPAS